jgi:hypothetical protein
LICCFSVPDLTENIGEIMKYALYPLGLLFAAVLTGCLSGNSSDGPADPGDVTNTIPYNVAGNTIISGPIIYTETYCNGDLLRTESDTSDADTLVFQITGSKLTVFGYDDTLQSGAVIELVSVFTREGSGTGLRGLWTGSSQVYRVISGTLSEEEESRLEENERISARYMAIHRSWVRFTDNELLVYRDREYAKQFLSEWNGEFSTESYADSAQYAITVKAVDRNTVELNGRENGETVRITLDADGKTYSSDMPGHALHRYLENPTTCPNDYEPAWYWEFLEANRSQVNPEDIFGLQKKAENRLKWENSRHFPFGPLKTAPSLLN